MLRQSRAPKFHKQGYKWEWALGRQPLPFALSLLSSVPVGLTKYSNLIGLAAFMRVLHVCGCYLKNNLYDLNSM